LADRSAVFWPMAFGLGICGTLFGVFVWLAMECLISSFVWMNGRWLTRLFHWEVARLAMQIGIPATLYQLVVWLPLWLTQRWHPVFRIRWLAALTGLITASLGMILFSGLGFKALLGYYPGAATAAVVVFWLTSLFHVRSDEPEP